MTKTKIARDLGFFQVGDYVPLPLFAVDANSAPAWPSSAPTIITYDASDPTVAVETLRPPAWDALRMTGLFRFLLRLGSSYAASKTYVATLKWTISAVVHGEMYQWATLPGGDSDGAVIGATFLKRPEANVVVYVLDSGKLKSANNPR